MKRKGMKSFLRKHPQTIYYLAALLGLIIIITFFNTLKVLLVALFFVITNVVLRFYKRLFFFPLELELITFGTVLCTYWYGLQVGIFVAIFGTILAEVVNQFISIHTFVMAAGYIMAAFLTLILTPETLVWGGFTISIMVNILIFTVFSLYFATDIVKNTLYSGSNLIFNYFLFTDVLPLILKWFS